MRFFIIRERGDYVSYGKFNGVKTRICLGCRKETEYKKIICLTLVLTLLMSISFTPAHAVGSAEKVTDVTINNCMISGTKYYKGMDVIENNSQLNYELYINEINFDGNNIRFRGKVFNNEKTIGVVDDIGILYKSTAEKLLKVNGITAIFSEKDDFEIVSCIFERNADIRELLPVNEALGGKTVIKVAIRIDDEIIYFEGEIPISDRYTTIYNSVLEASNKKEVMSVLKDVRADKDISEKEAVQLKEHWKHSLLAHGGEAEILEKDEKEAQTRASSPIVGVPISVFTREGTFVSVHNPSNPYMGYYAVTYSMGGTNNFVTHIIKWEYLYNPCDNFSVNSNVALGGAVGFTITEANEYTYYAVTDSVEFTNRFIPYRIKNASIEMGLRSDEQIITYVNRGMQANGSPVTVNWKSLLGLLPFGQYYSAAVTMFNAIEYRNKNISTTYDSFQATAAGQNGVYGKLVRGYKLTDNGKYFIEDGDKLNVTFTVTQPTDLTRTVRQNAIGNKYYFEIYERHTFTLAYSELVYSVNQTRESYYNVY